MLMGPWGFPHSFGRNPHASEVREPPGVEIMVEEYPNFMGLGA
jgi:hypothetical protein